MRNDLAVFHIEGVVQDELGQQRKEIITNSEYYVSEHSISLNEITNGRTAGFQPKLLIKVSMYDWQEETLLTFKGVQYNVYRQYLNKKTQEYELYCEEKEYGKTT